MSGLTNTLEHSITESTNNSQYSDPLSMGPDISELMTSLSRSSLNIKREEEDQSMASAASTTAANGEPTNSDEDWTDFHRWTQFMKDLADSLPETDVWHETPGQLLRIVRDMTEIAKTHEGRVSTCRLIKK